METTNCKLCGGNAQDAETLGIFRDIAFGKPGEFPLVRCHNCGLIYYRQRPTSDEINQYYPDEYLPYRRPIQDERFRLMRWARWRNIRKRCQIIEEYSPKSMGRILDVGCSTGIFLNAMQIAGWKTQGIEINPAAVQLARQRFKLDVLQGQLDDFIMPPMSFDVITFWDVIEHTFDPLATLRKAYFLLGDSGVVIMTLPHWKSFDHWLFCAEWIGYDAPRHLYIFPREVMRKLLETAGFDVLRMWCGIGGYFTFVASLRLWLNVHVKNVKIREVILKFTDIPGIRFLFQPFFSITDRLNAGGTLVVVAQKSRN